MGLALTRRHGEKILIGDDVVVQLVSAKKGKAILNITAPEHVLVDREEYRKRLTGSADIGGESGE